MLNAKTNPDSKVFELSFGKRPAEELYENARDPYQMHNLADEPRLVEVKRRLAQQLIGHLGSRRDPRALGEPTSWDSDPFLGFEVRGPRYGAPTEKTEKGGSSQ